jgi:hypothetical protein
LIILFQIKASGGTICANEKNMKIKLITSLVNLLLLFSVLSCSSTRVVSFHSDTARFGSYFTYKIEHPYPADQPINDRVKEVTNSIESKIGQEMESRGYKRSEDSDLITKYRINLNPNSETDVNNNRYPRYGYLPYYDPYFIDVRTYDYIEGIVLVEIMDRTTRKLVWQGSKDVRFNPRRESSEAVINETINEIFDTYLYQAGESDPVIN